jgi:hypothetical protein
LADTGEHAGVVFLVNQNVGRLRFAENMAEGFERPVIFVL